MRRQLDVQRARPSRDGAAPAANAPQQIHERRTGTALAAAAALALACAAPGQSWQETCGRTPAGAVARAQAARDTRADSLVLLVAAHPDDGYLLPAVWLRSTFGYRVAVLLATRGGGGQNSLGPETGDELERIRTLETEAGCALAGATAWYLNRPDGGYRRSADETFAEWGREGTLRDLVRLLRTIRPDAVMTTHHAEEPHGHDQALVQLLPDAVRLAGEPSFAAGDDAPPHAIRAFFLGGGNAPSHSVLAIDADRLDDERGTTLRRRAHDILRGAHVSPGPPGALDAIFDPLLKFAVRQPERVPLEGPHPLGLPSLFDDDVWPWSAALAAELTRFLDHELPQRLEGGAPPLAEIASTIEQLRRCRAEVAGGAWPSGTVADAARSDDVSRRLERRIEALERLLLILSGVQIEIEAPAGTAAVAGEEFPCSVRVLTTRPQPIELRVEGIGEVSASLQPIDDDLPASSAKHSVATVRVLGGPSRVDPMSPRFAADRFVPPVQLRFFVRLSGIEVPVDLTVPVELRAPVTLAVVPRMLLLPSGRDAVQFSVAVDRHTQFPIGGELEVRAPAGYAIQDDRHDVSLREQRSDLFGFEIVAPKEREPGVDMLRIRFRETKVALPVHKIDVQVQPLLRIGVLRSRDDALTSVLGVGGLGLDWSELTDADVAAADLRAFDTIVVDIRALRDRPAARRGFRRLLDFAAGRGRRLVLFYQKDVEFHPAGEAFVGAPFTPFQIGKNRVTRPDAPVRVLRRDHVLLRFPNVVQPGDFDGWEQERALYLPHVYGPQYEEVLEVHDPGQPVERGALLYARTGEGEYVYCALALWRQLKKLHPGAVRLLANLLTPSRSG